MTNPTQMLSLRIPADLAQDLDAFCSDAERTRSEIIIEAIRARLEREPAAERSRDERAAAIVEKIGTGQEMTDPETVDWWRAVDERIAKAVTRELDNRQRARKRALQDDRMRALLMSV